MLFWTECSCAVEFLRVDLVSALRTLFARAPLAMDIMSSELPSLLHVWRKVSPPLLGLAYLAIHKARWHMLQAELVLTLHAYKVCSTGDTLGPHVVKVSRRREGCQALLLLAVSARQFHEEWPLLVGGSTGVFFLGPRIGFFLLSFLKRFSTRDFASEGFQKIFGASRSTHAEETW